MASQQKTVLGLNLPTDPRWINIATMNIEDILIDHAYCEQKAASSCISLIIQYSEFDELVAILTPIVAEEWGHFRRVLKELEKRNLKLGKPRKDEYVLALKKIVKKGGSKEQQLVENLLLNALIEARSCERFKLLSQHISEKELRQFYYELMVAEAGHYHIFLNLAKRVLPQEYVMDRWSHFLIEEAQIIKNLQPQNNRLH